MYQKAELSNCHSAKTTGARMLIFWTHAYLTKDFLNKLRDQCNQKYWLNLHGKKYRNVAVVGNKFRTNVYVTMVKVLIYSIVAKVVNCPLSLMFF